MKKTKFRENTADSMPLADVSAAGTTAGAPAPGAVPAGKLGVYDARGQRVGHMGPKAGAPTASRFLKGQPAKLGKVDGKDAWVATGPTSGRNSTQTPGASKHAAQLRMAKGSVTKTPTAPKTSARPKR